MKKFLFILTAAVCVAICAFGLVACNNDSGEVEVEDITLDEFQLILTEGESRTLIATITPSNATDQTVEWSSSDENVATVDSGSVYAVSEGEAVIQVTTANGKTNWCVVTVKAPEEPTIYTVTYYAQGGEFEDGEETHTIQIVERGQLIDDVTVTRGDEYEFIGWYKDENREHAWNFDEDIVTGDTRLFAGWKYLNKYQSVIDALADKVEAEKHTDGAEVEILLVFVDNDGYLCFVEKDASGAFLYKTDINGFDTVAGNAEIISAIPNAKLTLIKNYIDYYTSDSDSLIADGMAFRYSVASNMNEAVIYSCVSPLELDTEGHLTGSGPYYSCKIKAVVVKITEDDEGNVQGYNVYDFSILVVAPVEYINYVLSGTVLSSEFDEVKTELGEVANDFFAERVKENEA
ncbi:MAG: Ig-like domain-containing protein [Clostridia bacterium]|nr:Ig-like domain-containing protein [Clostridia bacterium]